jgi:hypothetical protein
LGQSGCFQGRKAQILRAFLACTKMCRSVIFCYTTYSIRTGIFSQTTYYEVIEFNSTTEAIMTPKLQLITAGIVAYSLMATVWLSFVGLHLK